MEFIGLKIFALVVAALFGFGVGRKWESLNSPSDVVAFYNAAKDKVLAEIGGLEKTIEDGKAKLEDLKKLIP